MSATVQEVSKEHGSKIDFAEGAFLNICRKMDVNGDGNLNVKELRERAESNEDVLNCLRGLETSVTDLETAFWMCDGVDESGDVCYMEFLQQLRRLQCDPQGVILSSLNEVRTQLRAL